MNEGKWKKLPYILSTPQGNRSLLIRRETDKEDETGIDIDRFNITESTIQIGYFLIGSHKDTIHWQGLPDAFTNKQLEEIVSYIQLKDTLPEDNTCAIGGYELLNYEISTNIYRLTIEKHYEILTVDIVRLGDNYEVRLNGTHAASIIKLPEAWKTKSQLVDEALLYFILYYMDEHDV